MLYLRFQMICLAIFVSQPVSPETLNIAVASNFKTTLEKLIESQDFKSGHEFTISSGSTGSLYAQIINGAPFDIFLAADKMRPLQLEQNQLIKTGSRKTYAIGQLVLWVPGAISPITDKYLNLFTGNLAIANPKIAPYGLAAQSLLRVLDINGPRVVTGENIAQAYQFVYTGNAQAGLVALPQILDQAIEPSLYWQVPQQYYEPIEQQMVILHSSPASIDFAIYMSSETARNIITTSGYQVPGIPHGS